MHDDHARDHAAEPPAARRLFVLLDGTWNAADGRSDCTNIVRLRNAVPLEHGGVPHRVYYDEGVGTAGLIDTWVGGAIGLGLGRNVRQAYKWLSRHYQSADAATGRGASEIFVFGFSRGAYTARSLAGYIAASGLLRAEECTIQAEEEAWLHYRTFKKDRHPADTIALARRSHPAVRIRIMGVFDTVGALGIPVEWLQPVGRHHFQFHDTRPSDIIDTALHAVALDEKRGPFQATLWERPYNEKPQAIEQVWFVGAHADIGGGYADNRLAEIALHWVVSRIEALTGLVFDETEGRLKFDDAALRRRAEDAVPHESRTLLYSYSRVRPRFRFVAAQPLPPSTRARETMPRIHYRPIGEMVHRTVLDRVRSGSMPYLPVPLLAARPLVGTPELPVVDYDGRMMGVADVLENYADFLGAGAADPPALTPPP